MSSSLKYLLLVAPAALMIAILFCIRWGFAGLGVYRAGTAVHPRSLPQGLRSTPAMCSSLIVLISVALLALLAIPLSAVIALSPCRPVVRLLVFVSPAAVYSFYRCCPDDAHFSRQNGLMNNALVAADRHAAGDARLGWKG